MIKRYENTRKSKYKSNQHGGKRKNQNFLKYDTTFYSNVPQSNSDIYVITQYGDRLDLLASQFYGDPSLWWYIARANDLNTLIIPENIQLRIPGTTEYAKGR